ASTILLAQAYPNSQFIGYDYHGASIQAARRRAADAGVAERVRFEVAAATDYPEPMTLSRSSTACMTWAIPWPPLATCATHWPRDGTWMLFEPAASDRVEDNLNPVGRPYYAVSTMVCAPASL